MSTDRKILYISSYAIFALLLLALFIPTSYSAVICAALLTVSAALFHVLVKKRAVHSFTKNQVTALLCLMGLMYVVLYYISGLYFKFAPSLHPFSLRSFFTQIIPITVAIIASETVRSLMLAQKSKQATVLSFCICVIGEILMQRSIPSITSFYTFVDIIAQTFMPAIISNLLYTYLSRRYGIFPNICYRLPITLFPYIIPIVSGMPSSVYSIVKLFVPILIYFFIDALYEKKKKNALRKKHIAEYIISGLCLVIAIAYVMLISCQFTFGLLVIATPSMTGEINKGDAIIYKQYDSDRSIEVGQILVFEKNGSTTVHRVVEIDIIDGQTRYFTKGDANEDNDAGYITRNDITGIVEYKIPLIGHPTLWLRSLFKK